MRWLLLLLLIRILKLIETLYEDKFMRSLVCLQGCNFKKFMMLIKVQVIMAH